MRDKDFDAQESALDQFVTEEKELTSVQEFVDQMVHRGPWWAMSLVVHLVALWVMYQWPVTMAQDKLVAVNIPITIVDGSAKETAEKIEPPEEREFFKEPVINVKEPPIDLPIKDIQDTEEMPSKWRGEGGGEGGGIGTGSGPGNGDGVDMGLPQEGSDTLAEAWRPVESVDPPSNTPVFGVLDRTKHGLLNTGIYTGRWNKVGGRFLRPGGGGSTVEAESCVSAGLRWLVKAQAPDGHWDCKSWDGGGNYDVGMTGLALLAFLGAGYTHTKGRYKDTVARGLDWLRYNQKPNGAFGYQTFYEQGIATMAVSEAFGMTRSDSVRMMAQKAVDFICQTQPDHGGFRYAGAVDKESGDMSVTGWQIMAIKSAICSELTVPVQAIDRSREFLKNTFREYGGSAYIVSQPNATPAMSAIGMACRQFLGDNYDAEINAAANYLLEQQKKAGAPNAGGGQKDVLVSDLYYTYYSVLAMFQMGGEYWVQWNKAFRDPLVKLQEGKVLMDGRGRFVRGSWDPKDTMWGAQGGRVFSTAMAILCLEVYYRFLPVYKKEPAAPQRNAGTNT